MCNKSGLIYKISITGDLGSGKSTVCKLLEERINAKTVSVGSIQRAMAKDMGMTTYEFNRYMEDHPEIDDQFDTMLKSYDAVNDCNLLFDSRLAWNFVPSAFSVYVTTDLREAARRVFNANRENEGYSSIEEAMDKLSDRRSSEILRYSTAYGVEIKNLDNYDFIVDSTSASPEEVAGMILCEYEKYARGEDYVKRYLSPCRLYPLPCASADGTVEVFEYNDFYYVTAGTEKLRQAIADHVPAVDCMMQSLKAEEKSGLISENLTKDTLQAWERDNGFKLIRYPFK